MSNGSVTIAGICALALAASGPSAARPRHHNGAADKLDGAFGAILRRESEFATDVARMGIVPAFRTRAADDAVMFLPAPIVVKPTLATANWPGSVEWAPSLLASSRDGSLILSAGPCSWLVKGARSGGWFVTIWRKDRDGQYRFIVDTGIDSPGDDYSSSHGKVVATRLKPAVTQTAFVDDHEARFSSSAAQEGESALLGVVDEHAIVMRDGADPASSLRELRTSKRPITYVATDTGGSTADGLTYVMGRATRADAKGYFLRVWQFRQGGWRVILDKMAWETGK